jgi:uncharacterized protein YceH (UPF0502 family)
MNWNQLVKTALARTSSAREHRAIGMLAQNQDFMQGSIDITMSAATPQQSDQDLHMRLQTLWTRVVTLLDPHLDQVAAAVVAKMQ